MDDNIPALMERCTDEIDRAFDGRIGDGARAFPAAGLAVNDAVEVEAENGFAFHLW